MTVEEAYSILSNGKYNCDACLGEMCNCCEYRIASKVAIELFEKQMPKKPTICNFPEYPVKVGVCSVCNEQINGDMKYCDNCGQKIDWSE